MVNLPRIAYNSSAPCEDSVQGGTEIDTDEKVEGLTNGDNLMVFITAGDDVQNLNPDGS